MTDIRSIKLGEQSIPLPPIPLGRVRKLPVICNRVYAAFAIGVMDDAVADDILQILVLGTGMTAQELDAIPAEYDQLQVAVEVICEVAGLKAKSSGEAGPKGGGLTPATTQSAGGTTSTPT